MSITIDVTPPLEAVLRQRAELAGVSLESYLLRLAEMDANVGVSPDPVFDEAVRQLEAFRGKLGPVPDGAMDPKSLYRNR